MTTSSATAPLRIGVLGAARITGDALLEPAKAVTDVAVSAVAARDSSRAASYAAKHGIPAVRSSYDDLLADPDIDAVYIPTPAALHGRWAIAALEAGKHVLVEKPFTANADEARIVADAGERSGLVLMEAFHSLYHPLLEQLRDLIASGVIGEVTEATGAFDVLIPPGGDIRWNVAMGGGSLMDLGCYPVRVLQALFGYEPTVIEASAVDRDGIDASIAASLDFSGIPATISAAMVPKRGIKVRITITGTEGKLRVRFPYAPQQGARIKVRTAEGTVVHKVEKRPSYEYQLEAFRDAVLHGVPLVSGPEESVAMMRVIDDIYEKAGMAVRQPALS